MKPLPFEALKIAMRQTREGTVISFVIHPSDVLPELITDPIGTAYQLVAVKLGADGQPEGGAGQPTEGKDRRTVEEPRQNTTSALEKAQRSLTASAGILCRDQMFQQWFDRFFPGTTLTAINEHTTAERLCEYLGIRSRSALKHHVGARAKFFALRKEYDTFKQQQNGIRNDHDK